MNDASDGSADYGSPEAAAAPGHAEEAARPATDTTAAVTVRFTVAQAEAISDGLYGPLADGWPDGWIGHEQAWSAAVAAVEAALNGNAGPDVIELLDRAQLVLDHALHATLTEAARAADVMVLANHLHAVDGCWIAQRAHPLAVEPGGYRRDRVPRYLSTTHGERWLSSGPGRKRCRRCWPGETTNHNEIPSGTIMDVTERGALWTNS